MQEYHVTAAGRTYELERPFFVLATQNPIELEGTYPLPEAQLDRFLFNVVMTYLSEDDEVRVVTDTTSTARPEPARVLTGADILHDPGIRAQVIGRRGSRALRRPAHRQLAAGARRAARLHPEVGEVGRRPARVACAGDWRQGARAAARPPSRVGQGHPGAGQTDPAAPRAAEFLRGSRRHLVGSHRRPVARRRAGARQRVCRPWPGASRYLDPAIVARLGTIDLKARTIVEGFLTGLHRSPYKGFSVEFAEYRQYLPGDDLATLDWKVFARSDKHFVKKYEEETNLTCHMLIDVSRVDGLRLARVTKLRIRIVSRRRAGLPDEPAARCVSA